MPASADRNLLFSILALQLDFVSRDKLVAAMNAWVLDKSKPLGQVLVEQGALPPSNRDLLEPLVDQHVRDHGGDPQQSLASLSSASQLFRQLAGIGDPELHATLSAVAAATAVSTVDAPQESGLRYRVLRPHARGGLGEVFVAEDTELHRQVALKEIQERYAHDAGSRGRFLLEAEVTGRLEHPGIVPVYGLGCYPDGRPYYAMRFIKGDNLGEAIRRFHARSPPDYTSLEFRRLLQRFLDVCNAVAYAHSRGVLHRDLKPGNVMLGEFGETLLVDWGLAKIVGRSNAADNEATIRPASGSGSVETQAGSAVGTPAYMSPEQAEGKLDELGPATDVYSLGATLYVLLTGRPPVGQGELADVLEKVRRGDIPAPQLVQPAVPKPLEAVCRKAMELRPGERYDTAQALAADVEHWLADEPVTAYVEPLGVRAQRWVRRHPGAVASLAASVLVGALGLGTGLYFVNAERQRTDTQRAEAERLAEIALRNEREARDRQDETAAVLTFVEDNVFETATPRNLGRDVKLADAVQAALPRVGSGFADKPLIEARMRTTLGISFLDVGKPEVAEQQFLRARSIYGSQLGREHPDTLKSMNNLARSYADLGRHVDALALREETLKLRQAKLGPDHPDTLESMNSLAGSYTDLGRHAEALALNEQTLKLRQAKLGSNHPDTLTSMCNLASSYNALGRSAEALTLHEETLKLRRAKLGHDHPDTLYSMNNLAVGYRAAGRLDRALPLFEETLKLMRARHGPDHPDTLTSMNNLASSYTDLRRHAEALALHEEALKLRKAKLGPDHPETLTSMNNLGAVYYAVGRYTASVAVCEETLKLLRAKLGPDHPHTFQSMSNLASCYTALARHAEALALREETLRLRQVQLGPDHPDTLNSYRGVVASLITLKRSEDALRRIDELLALAARAVTADKRPDAQLVPRMHEYRVAICRDNRDAAGCRTTAEMWEKLERNDAASLYQAACIRSICTAVMRQNNEVGADEQANLAMTWLAKAVAAGYANVTHLKKNKDFNALHDRDDFKKLVADLEAKAAATKSAEKAGPPAK